MENENLNIEKLTKTTRNLEKQIEKINKFLNFEKYDILEHNPINNEFEKYDILEHNPINNEIENLFKINKMKDILVIDWLEEKIKAREETKSQLIFINGTKCEMFKRLNIEIDLLNNLIKEIKKP